MVSNSKTEYTSPPASCASSYAESWTDIRAPGGDEDMNHKHHNVGCYYNGKPESERSTYMLERDPSLAGRRRPTNLPFCPHCSEKNIRTQTKTYPNAVTWGAVAVGALVFFPICWVPLVVDNMKKTDHYCQSCGQKLATIKPLEGVGVKERL